MSKCLSNGYVLLSVLFGDGFGVGYGGDGCVGCEGIMVIGIGCSGRTSCIIRVLLTMMNGLISGGVVSAFD